MKLWLDDVRTPPDSSWRWVKSVWGAISAIEGEVRAGRNVELASLDHDLGDYAKHGGDGMKLLVWLVDKGYYFPIVVHSLNCVGRDNMIRVLKRYWPQEYRRQ